MEMKDWFVEKQLELKEIAENSGWELFRSFSISERYVDRKYKTMVYEISVTLIAEEDVLDYVCDKADSGEWFVIPAFSPMGRELLSQIEREFFIKDNNDKFHLLFGSFGELGFGSFALAKRSEIDPKVFKEKFNAEFDPKRDFFLTEDFPPSIFKIIHEKLLERETNEKHKKKN
jgi:hypothetical protein